jgi:hypothetical protein
MKTQEKLYELKKKQKKDQQQKAKNLGMENNLKKRIDQQHEEDPNKITDTNKNDQINKSKLDEKFSYFKSSTPRDLSPQNISPIRRHLQEETPISYQEVLLKKDDYEDHYQLATTHSHFQNDMKKISLINQRVELMNEQQQLRELLEKQEQMLREKQAQIMLQQNLHRERLESLSNLNQHENINQNLQYKSLPVVNREISEPFNVDNNNYYLEQAGKKYLLLSSLNSSTCESGNKNNINNDELKLKKDANFEKKIESLEPADLDKLTSLVYKKLKQEIVINRPKESLKTENTSSNNIDAETDELVNFFNHNSIKDNFKASSAAKCIHNTTAIETTNNNNNSLTTVSNTSIQSLSNKKMGNKKQSKNDHPASNYCSIEETQLIKDLFFLD